MTAPSQRPDRRVRNLGPPPGGFERRGVSSDQQRLARQVAADPSLLRYVNGLVVRVLEHLAELHASAGDLPASELTRNYSTRFKSGESSLFRP